jgi:FlaA1/EpsC-like NDP-sugar epimerase
VRQVAGRSAARGQAIQEVGASSALPAGGYSLVQHHLARGLCELPRHWKRRILVILDFACVALAFWAAYALRLSDPWPQERLATVIPLFFVLPFAGVLVLWWLGVYRALLRSLERRAAMQIVRGVVAIALIPAVASFLMPQFEIPRSLPIIFALVLTALLLGGRQLAQGYFHQVARAAQDMEPVLVYGAGSAGRQLAAALDAGAQYHVVGFVDDDKALHGHRIAERPIHGPGEISTLAGRHGIHTVLLALPSISIGRRREILMLLSNLQMTIRTVPTVPELVSGRAGIEMLREVSLHDLLGRDQVDAHLDLLSAPVIDQSVMVTGAGGSIGGELCRQIVALQPKRLILFERSEHALYEIERELLDLLAVDGRNLQLEAVLGSVCDNTHLSRTIERFSIDTIYHAAACKHVPMVEHNVLEGMRNNVVGTHCVARTGGEAGVKRVILVSTDKAVRPTNVMGASKRWAEQIFQASQQRFPDTIYSMVRFGNVLASSGSVISRFAQQIRQGGPVTVTHPEIYRYFMSIPEAAQLVIQAGALAEGGEVFVLDMGEPLRIADLARHMIALHGLSVRDEANPGGDIEITYTGLRPGEKLYEELLIGNDPVKTRHPKIMQAREWHLSVETLEANVELLRVAISAGNVEAALSLLRKIVPEYAPQEIPLQPSAAEKVEPSSLPSLVAKEPRPFAVPAE